MANYPCSSPATSLAYRDCMITVFQSQFFWKKSHFTEARVILPLKMLFLLLKIYFFYLSVVPKGFPSGCNKYSAAKSIKTHEIEDQNTQKWRPFWAVVGGLKGCWESIFLFDKISSYIVLQFFFYRFWEYNLKKNRLISFTSLSAEKIQCKYSK